MSFRVTAAHSSRITKPKKAPAFKRGSSGSSPYSALPRRKPAANSRSKKQAPNEDDDDDDYFGDRLEDLGLVKTLATDLTLRDVPQAILYTRGKMWSPMPEQRAGMNSTRIAETLNFRASLPPIVTVSHIQALLNSPTTVEKEIAELVRKGAIRRITVGGRGNLGDVLILTKDMDDMISKSSMSGDVKEKFTKILHEHPTARGMPRSAFLDEEFKELMRAGFITSSTPGGTVSDFFSRPAEGSRGTMTSINSISKAASGSLAAVGGQGAVHEAGGTGGGVKSATGAGELCLALPATGPFLKVLSNARSHLISLLSKSKFRQAPETLLRQRWDGGIGVDDEAGAARRNRGEFDGVLPGRTKKWKQFYGVSFEWVLGECVGAGLVEVFNTGSVGRGVRAL